MGAYDKFPFTVVTVSLDEPSLLDESISIVEPKSFIRYQNMIAAEKELEEKTLLDSLHEVEEELSETQLSDNIFVHNANKPKGDET